MNNGDFDFSRASDLLARYKVIISDPNSDIEENAHAEKVMQILRLNADFKIHEASYSVFGENYFFAVKLIEMITPKTS